LTASPTPTQTKPDVSNQALFVGAFGAPGSGKSHFIKGVIRGSPAIVFDPGHEYDGFAFTDELKFYNAVEIHPALQLVLRPPFNEDARCKWFDRFCVVALAIARARGSCLVVIDELHLVTLPGHAPAGWSELVLTGRKFGARVIAASVRPALVDKSFWTVCTHVRTGRLNYGQDQLVMSDALNVRREEVMALKGHEFIQRNMLTGEMKRG